MRKKVTRFTFQLAVVALSIIGGFATFAQQVPSFSKLKLYDQFNGRFINPAKWYSEYQCGSGVIMECEHEILDGQLHFRVRGYGAAVNDGGFQFGVSSLDLTATNVTDIAFQATVQDVSAQGCPAPGAGTHGQGLLKGAYFNGGGGTAQDDVQAFLQFDHYSTDPAGVVYVGGFLQYQGVFFDNVFVGPVNVGERVIAELKWDKLNHQFVVSLIRPEINSWQKQYMPYSIPDSAPAVAPYRQLSANVFVENCVGTQTHADLAINFENILTD